MSGPGPYEAVVLADSIASGIRLTTLCATFPRFVLAEFNTHRVFSRNSASSRAIPVKRRVASIREAPVVPLAFGKNRRGMQAADEEVDDGQAAEDAWMRGMLSAVSAAQELAEIGVHKQWANRLCETFAWHTVLVSATEWDNFWALRISEYAQPEIRKVAEAMKAAMDASTPVERAPGDWHLPLVDDDEVVIRAGAEDRATHVDVRVKLSVSRCAAVSYERHLDHDIDKDLARYEKLRSAGHMSPFEHAAMVGYPAHGEGFGPLTDADQGEAPTDAELLAARYYSGDFIGNFRAPWIQHRKMLPGEAVFGSEKGGG